MAQFYAEIQGNRGSASRMGSKDSGMTAHVRGWDAGVRVVAKHEDGLDVFYVYATGGSHAAHSDRLIARVREDEGFGAPIIGRPNPS